MKPQICNFELSIEESSRVGSMMPYKVLHISKTNVRVVHRQYIVYTVCTRV